MRTGEKPEPKELRGESLHWFESAPGTPNVKEVLLYAMLVVYLRKSVADLNKWVSDVRRQRAAFDSQGAAGLPAEWRPKVSVCPAIYEPLASAFGSQWQEFMLEAVGGAMEYCLLSHVEQMLCKQVSEGCPPTARACAAEYHASVRV